MPSTTLQARIAAFENNAPLPHSPSPSPPNLGRRTSLLDLKDWVVEDSRPLDDGKTPTQPAFVQEPLITFDSPPKPKPKPKPANLSAPKLPPRQPSYTSLKSASSSSSPPKTNGTPKYPPSASTSTSSTAPTVGQALQPPPQHPHRDQPQTAFLYPPRSNGSLTVDTTTHKYPPPSLMLDVHSRNSSSHAPSSSISSFHSVSLSSDTSTDPDTPGSVTNFIATYPMDTMSGSPPSSSNNASQRPPPPPRPSQAAHRDSDTISLAESYEHVSPTASMISPVTERIISADWERALAKRKGIAPPKLPDRPSNSSNGAYTPTYTPTNSNRSSLRSPPSTPQPSYSITAAAVAAAAASSINSNSRPPSAASSPILKPTHSGSSISSPYVTTYQPRRAAPPPPPSRSSDRSSVQSFATTYSGYSYSSSSQHSHGTHTPGGGSPAAALGLANNKAKRPTPVPIAARRRYETVFCTNVIHRRKAAKLKEKEATKENGNKLLLSPPSETSRNRRAAGWRGLSVDLITAEALGVGSSSTSSAPPSPPRKGPSEEDAIVVDENVGPGETLEAAIVKVIWMRSGLPKKQLSEIWNECDPTGQGALTVDAFAKGMWRIDEELRRAQTTKLRSSASSSSLSSYKSRLSLRERMNAAASSGQSTPPPLPSRATLARPAPDLLR